MNATHPELSQQRLAAVISYYESTLSAMVAEPEGAPHCVLGERERQQILVQWNETQVDYAQPDCIQALFAQQARRSPDAVAAVFEQQAADVRRAEPAGPIRWRTSCVGWGWGPMCWWDFTSSHRWRWSSACWASSRRAGPMCRSTPTIHQSGLNSCSRMPGLPWS